MRREIINVCQETWQILGIIVCASMLQLRGTLRPAGKFQNENLKNRTIPRTHSEVAVDLEQIHFGPPARKGDENGSPVEMGEK